MEREDERKGGNDDKMRAWETQSGSFQRWRLLVCRFIVMPHVTIAGLMLSLPPLRRRARHRKKKILWHTQVGCEQHMEKGRNEWNIFLELTMMDGYMSSQMKPSVVMIITINPDSLSQKQSILSIAVGPLSWNIFSKVIVIGLFSLQYIILLHV